jgi:hypothetical protein
MIEPGQITLELLVGPIVYLYMAYITPILSAIAAYWADSMADESLKINAKAKNPAMTPEQLGDVYEFEHISHPLIAGLLAGIVVVWGAMTITPVGFEAAAVLAIGAGITARKSLGKVAAMFVTKNN